MPTRTPQPNVSPPPGAHFVDDWQPEQYRMVLGPKRDVAGEVEVWTSVAQRTDGTIDTGGQIETPLVHVDTKGRFGLTVEQARELAGVILDAVNELDGWTR